ncbi:hypothetical protein BJY52DRAFT_1418576, partial [Lactarius psammicola]
MAMGNTPRKYDVADHLFFKLQGPTPGALAETVNLVERIVKKHGGEKFWPGLGDIERSGIMYFVSGHAGDGIGEYGVGIWKEFLVEELGVGTVAQIKTIKRAMDPLGIMNPGKLYPDNDMIPHPTPECGLIGMRVSD